MLKKILLTFLLVITAGIAAFFIFQYIRYRSSTDLHPTFIAPQVEFSNIRIRSLDKYKIKMDVDLLIKNVLPLSIKVDSFQYALFMNDARIANSSYSRSFVMRNNDTSMIRLPISFFLQRFDSLLNVFEKEKDDSAEYRITSTFFTDLTGGKKFSVNFSRHLPLLYIPTVSLVRTEMDSFDFTRAVILLHVRINNENVFAIRLKDLTYRVSFAGNKWISGSVPGETIIAADSAGAFIFPLRVSVKNSTNTFFSLLAKGKNLDYKMSSSFRMVSENKSIDGCLAEFESEGTIGSVIRFVKK